LNELNQAIKKEIKGLEKDLSYMIDGIRKRQTEYLLKEFNNLLKTLEFNQQIVRVCKADKSHMKNLSQN